MVRFGNNVGKGKHIVPPIVFQGGVSKNIGVIGCGYWGKNLVRVFSQLGALGGEVFVITTFARPAAAESSVRPPAARLPPLGMRAR